MRKLLTLTAVLSALTTPALSQSNDELQARREVVFSHMGDNDLLILPHRELQVRNDDVTWPYRPSNGILYLTSIDMEETSLVMQKAEGRANSYLYAKPYDARFETWNGKIPTVAQHQAKSGIQTVRAANRLDNDTHTMIGRMLGQGKEVTVWLDMDNNRGAAPDHLNDAQKLAARLKTDFPEINIKSITGVIADARMVKSSWELEQLQKAVDVSVEGHKAAMKKAMTATEEYQVEASLEYVYRERGAISWGYPSIVASGANGTILHYQTNQEPMRDGAMMLIDAATEINYYSADITRTFPQNGRFNPAQKDIYQLVLDAQNAAINMTRAGVPYRDLSTKAFEVSMKGLKKLGLISREDPAQARMYVLHGLGHAIGLDVHDPGKSNAPLLAGEVWTIEPGIYVRKKHVLMDDTFKALSKEDQASIIAALDKYDGIGVRIEDDILVTRDGHKNMSADLPRTIRDIEAFMASDK